jgi:serine/threonine protein kinase
MRELHIKIADFGMSQFNLKIVTAEHGACYRAPEILKEMSPYDGEKADVFASAFILLAIFAISSFQLHKDCEDLAMSKDYMKFKTNGNLKAYWESNKLKPTQELEDLFAGMLQENPSKRWTVQQIIDCDWMKIQEEPCPMEVSNEADRIIEILGD